MGDLGRAVDGENVQIEPEQAAQGMRRFGDAGKAHDGVKAGVVFGQLHRAQHIIDRDLDINHRQIRDLPNQGSCTAPGDDAVVGIGRHLLYNGLAFLQISGKDVQLNFQVRLCGLLHGSTHSIIRRYAENSGMCLDHKHPPFIFETIITDISGKRREKCSETKRFSWCAP